MNDWAAMTRRKGCSFTDEGVLLNAIDLYWKQGCEGLPAPQGFGERYRMYRARSGVDARNTTDYDVDDDLIHWETVKESYAKAVATSEKARAAGIASGNARRNIRSAKNKR